MIREWNKHSLQNTGRGHLIVNACRYLADYLHLKTWMLFVWVLFVMASCKPKPEEITISGTINNPTGETVEVFYVKHLVGSELERVEVPLGADNAFSASLPLSEARFVYIRIQGRTVMLYLKPGAEIQITIDAANAQEVPLIEGRGDLESRFLVSYLIEMEKLHSRAVLLNRAGQMNPAEFSEAAEKGYTDRMAFLENYPDYDNLDNDFVVTMRANIMYEKYNLLLEYPMAFSYFNPEAGTPQLPDDFFGFLEKEGLIDDAFTRSRTYFRFLQLYLNRLLEQEGTAETELHYVERMFNMADRALAGLSREMILAEMVIMGLDFMELEAAEALHQRFLTNTADASIREVVQLAYDKVMALAPGQPAPQFTLADINGQQVSLSDFAGKVVYLDFWASWCGPCMREVPYAKELKKRMENETDLVFLYISVDTDETSWRSTVAHHQIEGIHLNVPGFNHQVPEAYNLKGVPTFFLIGRDGKIINNRPPRPSSPEIDQVLRDALAT